jgi:phosphate-selective porin OprO and OprP
MKRVIIFMGIFAWVFCAMNASAKTLEDVLKEKGVITEEDYKEVTKSKPFDYTLGKGFTFTTPDEKFQLTLGGRLQFRYTYTDFDINAGGRSDTSVWNAQRIRMIAQGYAYTKNLTYKLEFDPRQLASTTTYKGLIETYLNYRLIDEAQIKVGQMKTPFSRQELTSDGQLQFVDRSIVVEAFKPTYDIGAMLNGKIADGLAYYYAGVYGGAGQTTTRSSNDNMFVARAVVNPLGDMTNFEADLDGSPKPLLSIGANYFKNTVNKSTPAAGVTLDSVANYAAVVSTSATAALGNGGWLGRGFTKAGFSTTATDKFDVDSYGADLAFKWMGVSLQGEYLLGQAEAQSTKKLLRAQGFYAQAGYMIIPKTLEVAYRYSYLDPDRDVANDHVIENIGAVSYYFNKHNLKLQADIGDIHDQAKGAKTDDMQYRVQAQIIF